jgi:hypothetical protein
LEDETVWLTIDQMAELFQKSRSTINEHILNIYEEQELDSQEYEKNRKFRFFYQTYQLLQPRCHYLSGLQGKKSSGHQVSPMGYGKAS